MSRQQKRFHILSPQVQHETQKSLYCRGRNWINVHTMDNVVQTTLISLRKIKYCLFSTTKKFVFFQTKMKPIPAKLLDKQVMYFVLKDSKQEWLSSVQHLFQNWDDKGHPGSLEVSQFCSIQGPSSDTHLHLPGHLH